MLISYREKRQKQETMKARIDKFWENCASHQQFKNS